MKLKITYSYDGSKFQGSQKQPHKNSVEDHLQLALSRVGIFNSLISSSRTDKGVHANFQVSSVFCGEFFTDLTRLKNLINRHANPYINVRNLEKVDNNFHPRFDAKRRSYRYIINHGNFTPFLADYQIFMPNLDIKRLNEALFCFVGVRDFSDFCKVGSDTKSNVREIYKAFAYNYQNLTIITFVANGFLRGQVRLMIANAIKSLSNIENFKNQIKKGKSITRLPVPPNGLYLNKIWY